MGLPEELTEEEKAAEAAAAAKKAEAVNKKQAAFVSVKPITGLAAALRGIKCACCRMYSLCPLQQQGGPTCAMPSLLELGVVACC